MKTQRLKAGLKVGILGGGQLSRMLCLAGAPLGLEMHVLSANADDPAAQVTGFWHKGNIKNKKSLVSFLNKVDVATFESEFLDADILTEAMKKTSCRIFPSVKAMSQLQDRLTQKKLLDKYSLPTSPYVQVDDLSSLPEVFKNLGPFVLKTRRDGYDGYGTTIVKTAKQAIAARKTVPKNPNAWIAEKFIPFDREVAVMAFRSRNSSKDCLTFPFVESLQKDSRCFWVKGPLPEKHASMIKKIKSFLNGINYVGAMGIEFFEKDGQLLINELAPRVHNSGHYSQDAFTHCQFTQHLKCIIGIALGSPTKTSKAFAMINLLGDSEKPASWPSQLLDQGKLHWYGKTQSRVGRKMGHINTLADSPDKALKEVLRMRKGVKA